LRFLNNFFVPEGKIRLLRLICFKILLNIVLFGNPGGKRCGLIVPRITCSLYQSFAVPRKEHFTFSLFLTCPACEEQSGNTQELLESAPGSRSVSLLAMSARCSPRIQDRGQPLLICFQFYILHSFHAKGCRQHAVKVLRICRKGIRGYRLKY